MRSALTDFEPSDWQWPDHPLAWNAPFCPACHANGHPLGGQWAMLSPAKEYRAWFGLCVACQALTLEASTRLATFRKAIATVQSFLADFGLPFDAPEPVCVPLSAWSREHLLVALPFNTDKPMAALAQAYLVIMP